MDVKIGKAIDAYTFNREKKSVLIDDHIMLDFIDDGPYVHEVKKSKSMEMAHEMQVKYYIYVLNEKGLEVNRGVLHYPELKKKIDIEFDETDKDEIESIVKNIEVVLNAGSPPHEKPEKRFCKKCAFYELCYA